MQCILIIDDNITNLRVAMDYLAAYSYEILTARTGESGLERAAIAQPDLILLDVQMPGIDGFETCRRLKANPATTDIPVIFMTIQADADAVVRGLEAGAVDYIPKPIAAAEMLARIRTHLDLRTLRLTLENRVAERTAALESEIQQRKAQQAERDRLLETVRHQSEQLRQLTQLALTNQQAGQEGVSITLETVVEQDLRLLTKNLETAYKILKQAASGSALHEPATAHVEQAIAIVAHLRGQTDAARRSLDQAAASGKNMLENPLFSLSAREREVLQLVAAGKSTSAIADILVVTRGTVSTYRRRIMEKLGVDDLAGLIRFAVEHDLVES